MGLQSIADKFRSNIIDRQDQKLFIGSGHPDKGQTHSQIKLKDAVRFSEKDGEFSDTIAKSIIVSIYSEWDELYRHKVAVEAAVGAKNVTCDLMGDLRFVRHWIIHKKSVIDKDCTRIKILPWRLSQGEQLKVSSEMFSNLIDKINVMQVAVNAV